MEVIIVVDIATNNKGIKSQDQGNLYFLKIQGILSLINLIDLIFHVENQI